LKAHRKLRERYNTGRKDNPYAAGDLVFCRSHRVSSAVDKVAAKLCHRWSGPHLILRFVSPVTVVLGDPQSGAEFRRAHLSQLKHFKGNEAEVEEQQNFGHP